MIQDVIKSDGARKRLAMAIINSAEELGMVVHLNEKFQRRGDYNCIVVEYKTVLSENENKTIKIEVAHRIKEYPIENRLIKSEIDKCIGNITPQLISKYELNSFEMQTVSFIRTFIDKLFALADYYMTSKKTKYSRHLYDAYKLINVTDIQEVNELIENVRNERKTYRNCVSAFDNVDLKKILTELLISDYYKEDYNTITINNISMYDKVTYEQCKERLLGFIQNLKI